MEPRGVVLVEGTSDCLAVETLARRRGRDLAAEGVAVVPMGGYGNLPRLLARYCDVQLAGLYDTFLEQNLVRVIEPFSRVEVSHIAEVVGLPETQVEAK